MPFTPPLTFNIHARSRQTAIVEGLLLINSHRLPPVRFQEKSYCLFSVPWYTRSLLIMAATLANSPRARGNPWHNSRERGEKAREDKLKTEILKIEQSALRCVEFVRTSPDNYRDLYLLQKGREGDHILSEHLSAHSEGTDYAEPLRPWLMGVEGASIFQKEQSRACFQKVLGKGSIPCRYGIIREDLFGDACEEKVRQRDEVFNL